MTVACPDCRSVFRVDPAKVPATGVRARCSVCGGIIVVSGGTGALRTPARTPVSSLASAPVRATPSVSSSAMSARPAAPVVAARPTPVGNMPVGNMPVGNMPVGNMPVAEMPVADAPRGTTARTATPSSATPTLHTGAMRPSSATPAAAPGGISGGRLTPPFAPSATAGATPNPPGIETRTPPEAAVAAVAPTPRRTINPFLNADPSQRARRLARALVSDLVAYHPRKRDEGLAQGTLRQLFRDEIKKSYEEYVDQVGRELAERSPHFQEALNDILAGGQRLF